MYGAGLCAPIPPGAPRPRPSVQKAYAEVAVGVAIAQLTRRLRSETWSKTLSAPPSCWVLVLYAAHVQSPRAVPTGSPHVPLLRQVGHRQQVGHVWPLQPTRSAGRYAVVLV